MTNVINIILVCCSMYTNGWRGEDSGITGVAVLFTCVKRSDLSMIALLRAEDPEDAYTERLFGIDSYQLTRTHSSLVMG